MQISEIRIKLMEGSEDRLRAFCSITIDDCFVVRDLKIIDGSSGPFVAMPSRKLAAHCHRCGHKNHLRASYCNHCGVKLAGDAGPNLDSPQKLYADVAHPINSECREMIQHAVIAEFEAELARSQQPGYRSRYDDEFDEPESPELMADDQRLAEGANPEHPVTSGDVHPARIAAKASPPRPHFIDRHVDKPDAANRETARDRSDDFGAGIF